MAASPIVDEFGRPFARTAAGPSDPRRVAMLRGRYDAAQTIDENRRHWANADGLSADAANSPAVRRTLRNRARYEGNNNSYARGITLTLANDTIGTGPRLQMLLDDPHANRRIERAFAAWAKVVRLAAKLRTMRKAKSIDGEAFAMLKTNYRLRSQVKLDVRLIEADQVATPAPSIMTINAIDGIRFDDDGNPIEYDVLKRHPGSTMPGITGETWQPDVVPADQMIHLFREDRPGQRRGIPEIMPALPLFAQLRRYTLAVLGAAETAADFAGVLQNKNPEYDDDKPGAQPYDTVELEARLLTVVPDGYELAQIRAEQPATTYAEFKAEILNEIIRCLLMPFNVAAGNSSKYNYASGRLDHQTYFKAIGIDQSDIGTDILDRILLAWFNEAIFLPGYLPENLGPLDELPHKWFWDGTEHVDPVKEAVAQDKRLKNRTTNLANEYAKEGLDWENELRQAAKEEVVQLELRLELEARERELRTKLGGPAPGAPNDQQPAQADASLTLAAAADNQGDILLGSGAVDIQAAAGPDKPPQIHIEAYSGGVMPVPKFGDVVIDLAGVDVSGAIPILVDHDNSVNGIVGHGRATITGHALVLDGTATPGPASKQIIDLSQGGFPFQASVGIAPGVVERIRAGQVITVNGRTIRATGAGFGLVRSGRLREISIVPAGCDQHTAVTVAASHKGEDMDFQQWLESKGYKAEAELTAELKVELQAAFDAEMKATPPPLPAAPAAPLVAALGPQDPPVAPPADPPAPPENLIAELRASHATELTRINAIAAACDGEHADIEAKAVAEGWDETKTQLEVLRASRPTGPAIHMAACGPADAPTLEAALCTSAGLSSESLKAAYDDKTLQAAHTRHRGGIGLQETLMIAAHEGGYDQPYFRNGDLRPILQAAFSTLSLPGILSNVANKFLLDSFMAVEDTWRAIAATKPVKDFKTNTSYRLTGDTQFEQVAPDGTLKHATIGEESHTNKAETYGKIFSVTRQDIINDDLGALSAIPQRIGRGSALKLNDVFWAAFLDNSTFFTAARGNYAEGAGTALGIDSLTAAELLFFNQTDPDGKPLGINPAIILVPNALNVPASNLFKSLEIRNTTASTKAPTGNPHAGKFPVHRSSYMANSSYTGYSALAWFLLANPLDEATIEVAFLNGQQQPTVESADADFNMLGIQYRGFYDFGVSLREYRGGVKMKGEA